jgi:polysaccharide export outer membrane protein
MNAALVTNSMLSKRSASCWIRRLILLIAITLVGGVCAKAQPDDRPYRLAPGDRIYVAVFNQPDLSGDFFIDASGRVVLPFLEPLAVANLTVMECQKLVRDRFAEGLLKNPSVSVRIAELRPLYVLGDVRTPGAYQYRYGSTVQSAIAVAGGFGVAEQVQGQAASEFLLAEERVRQLGLRKIVLEIRKARLEAQRDGQTSFSAPLGTASGEGHDVAAMISNEKEMLEAQLRIQQEQIDLIRSQKPRIQDEIVALNGQIATVKKQIDLVKNQADQYGRLVKQGLGLANAEIQLKLSEGTQQSELWRLTAQISRLQKEEGDLDIKIQEVETTFRRLAMTELREVRDQLKELDVSLPGAREVRDVKLQYAGGFVRTGARRTMTVTRVRDGREVVMEAKEATTLEPGDVVDVRRILPWQGGAGQIGSLVDGPSRQTTMVDGQGDRGSMKRE